MSAVEQAAPLPRAARARLTPVAWLAHVDLTVDEWRAQGSRLGAASRSTNWWLGDWVRFGASHHGQKYDTATAVTGYDEQTLMNMVYVASRYEISRRRENLSWSHHAELAALELDQQERWLDRAAAEHFSVRALRREVKCAAQPTTMKATAADYTPRLRCAAHTCPRCGHTFRET